MGLVTPQNLHSLNRADLLIVTHPDYLQAAERLAQHRRDRTGLTVLVATTSQIYNEFSSGRQDVSAIRDFGMMLWQRDPQFRYVILLGDASFDARDILGLGTNFLPTYEHEELYTEVRDYPSDDFFAIYSTAPSRQPLAPDLNVATGRLPAKTLREANDVVDKIIDFDENPATYDDWRTRMVFVGDDEDSGLHIDDVDDIATTTQLLLPHMNFEKLYFDLFPQISLSAGNRYPDVQEGINRAVFRGALAITYLGHGGPRGWAQERVLTIPQIRNFRNTEYLPIFITATCTFAGYDDASFVSAGEELLLKPRGGAAALLTTTRPVFANANKQLTLATVRAMLERVNGEWRTLGDVIRIAKNSQTSGNNEDNTRKFTLLGDPSQVIALPTFGVQTTGVDTSQITSATQVDTIRALQEVTLSGRVVDQNGQLMTDFNGIIYPTVYDKPQQLTTLQQDPGSPARTFSVQRNVLFKGRATVTGGEWSFTFVVPSDINYEFGRGKVSYYAADPARRIDAAGDYRGLVIGGTSTENAGDDQGPLVEVFMNNEDFVFGGEVDPSATLLIKLSDDLGINVAGNSIGHDLEAFIDDDTRNSLILNDYYEAATDNYKAGTVRYPLSDLEPGLHTVRVRAWDAANNAGEGRTEFIVATDGRSALTRVLNYPNPFTDRTCFQFDHKLVGQDVDVLIQIYTVSGRLVKTLNGMLPFSDGAVRQDDCIEWNGLDDYGDQLARGVYLYRVRLRGQEETIEGEFEKLVLLK